MKKIICNIITFILCATSMFGIVACKKQNAGGGKKYDSETTPVLFSTQQLEGVFHPFFATSAYDSEIAGMTQVSMLTSDKNGGVAYGENEAVVTLDYDTVYYDKNKREIPNGDNDGFTEYQFVIKKGIKFSDGEDLTIKDVLFNLYFYLNPVYTGSLTIYSTDIVGLNAYRTQDPNASKDTSNNLDSMAQNKASERIQAIINYCEEKVKDETTTPTQQVDEDILVVKEYFKNELDTDWANAKSNLEDGKKEYTVENLWQYYIVNEGLVAPKDEDPKDGELDKDAEGRYIVDFTEKQRDMEDAFESRNLDMTSESDWQTYWTEILFESYCGDESFKTEMPKVVKYWNTANLLMDTFVNEAKDEILTGMSQGDQVVKDIKGIVVKKGGDFKGTKKYDDTYDVLSITINGIDPKAVWNFGFAVAPMHYYSGEYENKDYVATFDGDKYTKNSDGEYVYSGTGNFGFKYADTTFIEKVVKSKEKLGLPVGGGAYKASSDSTNGPVNKDTFYKNKSWVYFERNNYFYTILGDGTNTDNNAKVKYIRYKVVDSENIISALSTGEIDFGDPSAKQQNLQELENYKNLQPQLIANSGYGYVGINPRFVEDINVRRAIMMSFDPSLIITTYFKGELAEVINRPMSKESWAYPELCEPYYQKDKTGDAIVELLESVKDKNGKQKFTKKSDGKYHYTNPQGKDTKLKYTFTIAGATDDHPAVAMFQQSQQILNDIGFEITIAKDGQTLTKLSNGELAVWAAAWSSTIDPDMFQIYHKYSSATSVLNWGYKQILNDLNGVYDVEKGLIDEISDLIDEGRETLDQEERIDIYSDALDKIMELAVEFPTYQRKNLSVYNKTKIDSSSLTPTKDLTAYNGLLSRIWEMELL